jgi:hypothetical protein
MTQVQMQCKNKVYVPRIMRQTQNFVFKKFLVRVKLNRNNIEPSSVRNLYYEAHTH